MPSGKGKRRLFTVRAVVHGSRWRLLAALLDARCLIALLAICFLVYPFVVPPRTDSVLDRWLFRAGVLLQARAVDTADFVRIDVPPAEIERFRHDPASARQLTAVLTNVMAATGQGLLLLPERQYLDYRLHEAIEANLGAMIVGLPATEAETVRRLVDGMKQFQSAMHNDKLLRAFPVQPALTAAALAPSWQQLLSPGRQVDAFLPHLPGTSLAGSERPVAVAGAGHLARPLLWQRPEGLLEDARLALLSASLGLGKFDRGSVSGPHIRLGDTVLPLSADGTVLPHFSLDSRVMPALLRYPADKVIGLESRRLLNQKTVVIAATDDSLADDLLYSVISLQTGHVALQAVSFAWLYPVLLVLILCYLLVIPYCTFRVSALSSLLLVAALLLAQQIVLVVHNAWFPVTGVLLFLLLGYLGISVWCVRRSAYPLATGFVDEASRLWHRAETVLDAPSSGPMTRAERIMPRLGDDDQDDQADTVIMQATRPLSARTPPQPATRAAMPRRTLGRYEVRGELGRGAMGIVYRGFDPKISREVAIKTLHYNHFDPAELPAIKERFFREASAAGRLSHPNIVTVLDVGEEPDLAFIAMDYVRGKPLSAYVKKDTLLEVELVYWIMVLVADAVDYAHTQGIVHRDIKPSNILFDEQANEVKVADFGIARFMDGDASRTRTGDVLGSPLYMSPEQIKGEVVTGSSDIFSLGVTFYQLLSGELPFKGDTLANLSYQIIQGKFSPVDEVRAGLPDSARRITGKALQKNPANRYASAGDMAEALQRAYSREFS